jgi:CheY-like chemotaxis protein
MAGKGTVRLSAENMNIPGGVKAGLPAGGEFIRIDIQDTGIGIPDQDMNKIFDPYFTTKQKGSGLGLATSFSIIKYHGGLIEVNSELNKGSTFSIYLPASKDAEFPDDTASPALSAKRGRILIMDDEALVRNVVKEMIVALGHELKCAAEGGEALEMFRHAMDSGNPFDLVILDLTVKGGMGGEETIRRLREIDPNVKAIVSSGYADSSVVANYRAYGFSAFLNKPYKADELRECLNSLL